MLYTEDCILYTTYNMHNDTSEWFSCQIRRGHLVATPDPAAPQPKRRRAEAPHAAKVLALLEWQ